MCSTSESAVKSCDEVTCPGSEFVVVITEELNVVLVSGSVKGFSLQCGTCRADGGSDVSHWGVLTLVGWGVASVDPRIPPLPPESDCCCW